MGRILIGNFKGPQGDQGTTGTDGRRGSRWIQGTAVTGTSTTPAVFSRTGITDALVDDVYMNTETGNIYRCTLSGDAGTAQWAYTGSLKGPTGATGAPGKDGATGAVDASTQIEFADIDTYVEMQSGNSIATLFSKIKKGLADLFSGKLDKTKVIASTNITEPGFVMDGKTVADAFSQLNSNLSTSTPAKRMIVKDGQSVSLTYNICVWVFLAQTDGTCALIYAIANRYNIIVGELSSAINVFVEHYTVTITNNIGWNILAVCLT